MQLLQDDERFLLRALELARDAAAFASPNPTVGCVVARAGEILGEGAHFYDNRDHAEIAALKDAVLRGHAVRGATVFVTLEPCSHHGRTGPCADALVQAGIARCVIATVDPNPLVRGLGVAKLRAAGIDIVLVAPKSATAQEARRLNNAFAFAIQHGRPFITLKAAVSREGCLAPAPEARRAIEPCWLTGPAARADVQQLRHFSDAILTGIGTVLADNPSLTDRTGLSRRSPLLRVVIDSGLRIPLDCSLLQHVNDDLLIITASTAEERSGRLLEELGTEVIRVPVDAASGRLDLKSIIEVLQEKQVRSVLVEAGPALNGSFLNADLVDRVVLYFSQLGLDPDAIPFATNGVSPFELADRLISASRKSIPHSASSSLQDTRVSGYLHDPWQGVE